MQLIRHENIKQEVGLDIWQLILNLVTPVEEVVRLTAFASQSFDCASFKLILSDSRILKARRFESIHQAQLVESLSQYLEPQHFPRVLASYGRALLMEWTPGFSITSLDWSDTLLFDAATVQANTHSTFLPESMRERFMVDSYYWLYRLEKKLSYLVERGLLSLTEAQKLSSFGSLRYWKNEDLGLIHGNYGPENIMLTPIHEIAVIDLEELSVSAISYDLARTLYLWPMTPTQQEIYYKSYEMVRGLEHFYHDLPFWMIFVLVESATYRAQARLYNFTQPLSQLKEIAQFANQNELRWRYGI